MTQVSSIHPHTPILVSEILDYVPKDAKTIVDGTVGYGGHMQALLSHLPDAKHAFGIDQDLTAIDYCRTKFLEDPRVTLVHSNFSLIPDVLQQHTQTNADFILVDLGISSLHLDASVRGFSFQKSEPLDMRMNASQGKTAADILATYSEDDLSEIFVQYGELRNVQKFSAYLTKHRGHISRTEDLVSAIKSSFFFRNKRSVFLRTCAQVFQALRIEVNQELHHLDYFLDQLSSVTHPGSRVAVISFHSLEDRRVKQFVKDKNTPFKGCHKKIITASQDEINQNSRASSAKLRIFERHPADQT